MAELYREEPLQLQDENVEAARFGADQHPMIAQEREEQGENVEAARFGTDQHAMIAQEGDEQGENVEAARFGANQHPMIAQEGEEQGENVEAARFGANQHPMIAQEGEEQGENVEAARFGTDQHPVIAQERGEQGESCASGLGGGQLTLVDVKTVEKLIEKIEKEKQKWKDKCYEYQELIEMERERSDCDRQVPQNGDITRLKEENTQLKTTVEELREKNLELTRQVRDLQYDVEERSAHQCNCQLLQVLLDRAQKEAREWEREANRWMREYEVVRRNAPVH